MIPTVKIDNSNALKKLDRVISNSQNLPWNQAGEIIKQSMQQNFNVGGRYSRAGSIIGGSTKWKPRKKVVAWKVLRKTGKLQKSFYYVNLGVGVKVGSKNLKYNAAQNYGHEDNNLPARPFLVVQPIDLKKIRKVFKDHIKK